MKRFAFLFILTAIILGSCTQVTVSPTQPVVDTVTPTVIPSQTPPPTPSAIPSATPYPPLHTQEPYLLFTRDNKSLTIMDADGSGRKQIQLPNDGYVIELEKSVSPDGNWIAYFTGSSDEPYDLALNIFDLKDESTFLIANLIAPGFPQNLEPVAKTVISTGDDAICSNDLNCNLRIVQSLFNDGIKSLAWSPNRNSLAFTAQIDAPSSDIYLFETENKIARRLTGEEENIFRIDWSPNGNSILYGISIPGMYFRAVDLQIADPQNQGLQSSKPLAGGLFWGENGWVTGDKFVYSIFGEGGPQGYDVQYLDVTTKKNSVVWRYSTESVLLDSKNKTIILSTMPYGLDEWQPEPTEGTYFVNLNGKYKKISNEVYHFFEKQDLFDSYFGIDINNQIVHIKFDGTIENLPRKGSILVPPRTSPDGKWILIIDNMGLELYSESLELIKSWDMGSETIVWRPDSKGAFLYSVYENKVSEISYLSIPDGDPTLVDTCSSFGSDCYPFEYVWLP